MNNSLGQIFTETSAKYIIGAVYDYYDKKIYGKPGVTNPPRLDFSDKTTFVVGNSLWNNGRPNYGPIYTYTYNITDPIQSGTTVNSLTIYMNVFTLPKNISRIFGRKSVYLAYKATEHYFNSYAKDHNYMEASYPFYQLHKFLAGANFKLNLGPESIHQFQQIAVYEKILGNRSLFEIYSQNKLNADSALPFHTHALGSRLRAHLYFENPTTHQGMASLICNNLPYLSDSKITIKNYTFGQFESDFKSNSYLGTLNLLAYAVPSLPPFYRMVLASNLLVTLKTRDALSAQNTAFARLALSKAHGNHSPLDNTISQIFYPKNEYASPHAMAFEVHSRIQKNLIKYGSGSEMLFEGISNLMELKKVKTHLSRKKFADDRHINRVLSDISLAIGTRNDSIHAPSLSDQIDVGHIESSNPNLHYLMSYYSNKQPYARNGDDNDYQRLSANLDRALVESAFAYSFIPHNATTGSIILNDSNGNKKEIVVPQLLDMSLSEAGYSKNGGVFNRDISKKMSLFQPDDIIFGQANFDLKFASSMIDAMKNAGNAKSAFLEYANMTTECCLGTNHFGTYLK